VEQAPESELTLLRVLLVTQEELLFLSAMGQLQLVPQPLSMLPAQMLPLDLQVDLIFP
jgi:hypothetical protein